MESIERFESKLDTNRFGYKIAKINDAEFLSQLDINAFKENGFELLIARASCTHIPLINALEHKGFLLRDTQLTYKFDLQRQPIPSEVKNQDLKYRLATENDLEKLKEIAAEAFVGYGHYFANEKLSKEKALGVYIDWTERSFYDRNIADIFFLAEKNDEICGYLSFKTKETENGPISFGGIGAVNHLFRGQNVFPSLAIHGLEWGKNENHLWQEHNVLTTNLSVNRAFSKIGFSIYKSDITLHRWL